MIQVNSDPELCEVIPMDVPNRFELLSLVIDSPINADQEHLIFHNMNRVRVQALATTTQSTGRCGGYL